MFRCGFLEILVHIDQIKSKLKVPDETDLKGIASGIVRLQKFYLLNAGEIADGNFNDVDSKYITAVKKYRFQKHN